MRARARGKTHSEMRAATLECEIEQASGAFLIRARGEIDLWTADHLRRQLDAVTGAVSPVVLDLRHVGYLDGAGFRVLAESTAACRAHHQPLVVVPSATVRRLLAMLHLDTELLIRDSLEDALHAAGQHTL